MAVTRRSKNRSRGKTASSRILNPVDIYNLMALSPTIPQGSVLYPTDAALEAAADEEELYDQSLLLQPGPKKLPFLRSANVEIVWSPGVLAGLLDSHYTISTYITESKQGVSVIGGLFNESVAKVVAESLPVDKLLVPCLASAEVLFVGATATSGISPGSRCLSMPTHIALSGDLLLRPKVSLVPSLWLESVPDDSAFPANAFTVYAELEVEWKDVTDANVIAALVASLMGQER